MTQCVGRFGLSYLLASRGAINDGGAAVSVASPGVQTKELDLDDLDLRKKHEAGRNRLLYLVDQGSRDSTVVDGFTEACPPSYPTEPLA